MINWSHLLHYAVERERTVKTRFTSWLTARWRERDWSHAAFPRRWPPRPERDYSAAHLKMLWAADDAFGTWAAREKLSGDLDMVG